MAYTKVSTKSMKQIKSIVHLNNMKFNHGNNRIEKIYCDISIAAFDMQFRYYRFKNNCKSVRCRPEYRFHGIVIEQRELSTSTRNA